MHSHVLAAITLMCSAYASSSQTQEPTIQPSEFRNEFCDAVLELPRKCTKNDCKLVLEIIGKTDRKFSGKQRENWGPLGKIQLVDSNGKSAQLSSNGKKFLAPLGDWDHLKAHRLRQKGQRAEIPLDLAALFHLSPGKWKLSLSTTFIEDPADRNSLTFDISFKDVPIEITE